MNSIFLNSFNNYALVLLFMIQFKFFVFFQLMNNDFEIISQSRAPSRIVLADYNKHTNEFVTVGPGYFVVSKLWWYLWRPITPQKCCHLVLSKSLYFGLSCYIANKYLIWKSKYYIVYILLTFWHITAHSVLLSSVVNHLSCIKSMIKTLLITILTILKKKKIMNF
jgi:hypothetical protein